MVDSKLVLTGQTMAYTIYCLIIILLIAWFAWKVTSGGNGKGVRPALFYSFVCFLAVLGVSLHLITLNTIPWVKTDLNRSAVKTDKEFRITIRDHKYILPSEKMVINVNDKVLFDIASEDLTYGFGLFREDNSMLFQMQVVPGHRNDIIWQFTSPGVFTIRSTEYSGPKGVSMIVKNAVEVVAQNISDK